MSQTHDKPSPFRPPPWLVEGLDIVRRRRAAVLGVSFGVIAVAAVLAVLFPDVVPPRWTVGGVVGVAGLLQGVAVAIALDATDPIVRGPRHIGSTSGELVAVLPTEPHEADAQRLAASVREARPDGLLRLGVAAAGRDTQAVAPWADALAVALARDRLRVLHIDLASGWSAPPGLDEVIHDGVRLTEAVEFVPGLQLARLGAGGNQASALESLAAIASRLPSDLNVLLVTLPTAASRKAVHAAASLAHVLIVGETDRTPRIDLIAGADALRTVGHDPQVFLLDDEVAGPRPSSDVEEALSRPEPEPERVAAEPAPGPEPAPAPRPAPAPGPEPAPAPGPEPAPAPAPGPDATPASDEEQPPAPVSDERPVEVIDEAHAATAAALLEPGSGPLVTRLVADHDAAPLDHGDLDHGDLDHGDPDHGDHADHRGHGRDDPRGRHDTPASAVTDTPPHVPTTVELGPPITDHDPHAEDARSSELDGDPVHAAASDADRTDELPRSVPAADPTPTPAPENPVERLRATAALEVLEREIAMREDAGPPADTHADARRDTRRDSHADARRDARRDTHADAPRDDGDDDGSRHQ